MKTLIPLVPGCDNESLLNLAHWLAATEPVLLAGVVPIPEGQSLSAGALPARELRDLIHAHIDRVNLRQVARIRVTYSPWDDLRMVVARRPSITLLILNWPDQIDAFHLTAVDILSNPPCDVALVRGPLPEEPASILVFNRGGPHAERALRLGLALARHRDSKVTSLNIRPSPTAEPEDAGFAGMAKILAAMPGVEQHQVVTDDQARTVLEMSNDFNMVVLGTTAHPTRIATSFGNITDTLFSRSTAAVMAVKTKRMVPEQAGVIEFATQAISVLVDRWFAENTYHADEFADLQDLVARKEEQGLKISLALPALNEEETIGDIIRIVQQALMEQAAVVDEIVLIDSNSTDRTREIASDLGVPVYIHQEVLPVYGARKGKGEALWKSLYVTEGDLIFWVDTDIKNFHPRFIYGLIGPLLHRPELKFVKGFYRRPLRNSTGLKPGRGGRVTELTARPMLNLFYPELSGIIQPLSGEYGGRREALEQLTFMSGYGVETGLLIEVFEKFKLASLAQVDQVERIHRNQSLSELCQMSFEIIQTIFNKLEKKHRLEFIEDVNRTLKSVRYESGQFQLDVKEIVEHERPPMIEIPEYCKKRGLTPPP
ncbi:MAG: glucosyl-3-phosphoglycerate synthase [Candidatus Neomarinimicrobiota bacterium]